MENNRNKIPRADRAVQFMPFESLRGFTDTVEEANRESEEKISLSDEEKEKISHVLASLQKNDVAFVNFYVGGFYKTTVGRVREVDSLLQVLSVDNMRILFDDILSIEKMRK